MQAEEQQLAAMILDFDTMLNEIGGLITTDEVRELILQKQYDIIATQLMRYADNECRAIISAGEILFDKYAVSAKQINDKRNSTMAKLDSILKTLNYID